MWLDDSRISKSVINMAEAKVFLDVLLPKLICVFCQDWFIVPLPLLC